MQIEREEQKAQEPSARVGDNQSEKVSTNEGSQLGSPVMAGVTVGKVPQVGK